jgi:hypothetical protein
MKRPLVLLSLVLCLQGCVSHPPMLRPDQDPAAVADSVARQGSGNEDAPPPQPEKHGDSKALFTALKVGGIVLGVVGVVALVVALSYAKTPPSAS